MSLLLCVPPDLMWPKCAWVKREIRVLIIYKVSRFCCSLTFCVYVFVYHFIFDEGYFWKGLMEDGIVCGRNVVRDVDYL